MEASVLNAITYCYSFLKLNLHSHLKLFENALLPSKYDNLLDKATNIRHLCRKTTVLSCHRCQINTSAEKMNHIYIDIQILTTICLYVKRNVCTPTME